MKQIIHLGRLRTDHSQSSAPTIHKRIQRLSTGALKDFTPNPFSPPSALEIWLYNLMITGDEQKKELNKIASACFVMKGQIFQI